MSKVKIYSDGASRGNPGEAGIGVVIYSETDEKLREVAEYIGIKTNNVAEYQALIRGLEEAKNLGATEVAAYADSELMVKQIRGEYKVKNAGLQPLYQKAKLLSLKFLGFQINHVPRAQNKEADLLANKGIDKKSDPTTKISNGRNEQVVLAFKEPSLMNDSVDSYLINGDMIALARINIKKGQKQILTDLREQIIYILEGKIEYNSEKSIKVAEKDDTFLLQPEVEYTCKAIEDSLILRLCNLSPKKL